MIVVVARETDREAAALCERAARGGALLLTPRALSRPGFAHFPLHPEDDVLATTDGPLPASAISGILVRLTMIDPLDLPHIHPEDRGYVATEMTAFLKSFLTLFRGAVLNRPHGSCLSGPRLSLEEWSHLAWRQGIDLATPEPRATLEGEAQPPSARITVVEQRVFGHCAPWQRDAALSLASAVGAPFMAFSFTSSPGTRGLLDASPTPLLDDPEVTTSVLDLLTRGAA